MRHSGLSLLELLVALSIMAIAVAMLYRALGAGVRDAGRLQGQQKAVFVARSLLAATDAVPAGGWNESGAAGGYQWRVVSQPFGPVTDPASELRLYSLDLTITWNDRGQTRHLEVQTLRPQRLPIAQPGTPAS
ncbi:prepilin-type N-terminal cleavage/methylation domain-containing protein [Comamonas sp. NLF-1-9]|uniref:prepilin-type N-terminal cleavage/methylation domain-containing protein n=1 Tax=Comamonas sp. NLF-1-9 TaxID=2853163 RepID=UPI001C441BEE|nr:prepilin-type N-terminal cleavage/methylation domain-containing protein [Comamonas sp. NLF-1-9]QXL85883.1 prepilin-type N-terminal cleavage/methylation domain-containing protein [Comamonas sp. NLF-1-9]